MDNEKKYKELVGKIKKAYLYAQAESTKAVLEDIFPELKGDEDEKIREALIRFHKSTIDIDGIKGTEIVAWLEKLKVFSEHGYGLYYFGNNGFAYVGNPTCDNVSWIEKQDEKETLCDKCKKEHPSHSCQDITALGRCAVEHERNPAWLEKQGEKPQGKTALEAIQEKPADNANKVEPKFHEGEWIVWENQYYKVNYNGCGYELVGQNGLNTSLEYGTVDENAHHWDIAKDAKEGDVLVSDNIVFIFNKIHDVWINCHCSLFKDDSFYGGDFDLMHIRYGKEVFPATKSQRDTLMNAMTKAGWQFDFEKKELKLLITNGGDFEQENCEQKLTWHAEDEKNLNAVLSFIGDEYLRRWLKDIIHKEYDEPTTWSEEDECYMAECISAIATKDGWSFEEKRKTKHWLESLKERVQPQPKQELSESDEEEFQIAIDTLVEAGQRDSAHWLESLKERIGG